MSILDIPCDPQQIDDSGYTWSFLDRASNPSVIVPGAIVVTGDTAEPIMARVVEIIATEEGSIVHLEVLPGPAERYAAAIQRSEMTIAS